mmetsp:Transcript_28429/g.60212  ORF Transcript_28429/g.60212 Transcript_28429/m.60212 type:complete len:382 (+) Transcript_28429:1168-2313(+)
MDLPMQGACHGKKDYAHYQCDNLPPCAEDGGKEGQELGGTEDVAVDLFPAAVFHSSDGDRSMFLDEWLPVLILLGVLVRLTLLDVSSPRAVTDGISGIIFPQRPQQNQSHQPHQEEHHHEAVEDAEPVDLMLEEGVVQVSVKPAVEGGVGLLPLDVQFKLEGCSRLDLGKRGGLGGQVDLDDPVPIVADVQGPLGVNVSLELSPRLGVPGHGVLQVTQIAPEMLGLGGLEVGEHLAHHAPHGEVVDVHLVEPLVLGGGGEQLDLRVCEGLGGASLQNPRAAGTRPRIHQVVPAVPQRVPPEPLPDAVRLQSVEAPSLLVGVVSRVRRAVRQRVVLVRLLGVGVRSDLVDPEVDAVALLIAVRILVGEDGVGEQCREERESC